jgi:hypothetical protein
MTTKRVRNELIKKAVEAYDHAYAVHLSQGIKDEELMRAAIEAIAPCLRAEGMREAMVEYEGHDRWIARRNVNKKIAELARADALSPPVKEVKP